MNEDKSSITNQIKISSLFIVAALSPSFLISLLCILAYLVTQFPEVKEPLRGLVVNFLRKAGAKVTPAPEEKDS